MADYDRMCKDSANVPLLHNIGASFSTWILLAGFTVLPGTFTTIRKTALTSTETGIAGQVVRMAVQRVPLLVFGLCCCAVGAYGMYRLWRTYRSNYYWLLVHVFLPGLLNSITGLLTTLINVYTAQGGSWSVTAIVTVTATATCTVGLLAIYLVYTWRLDRVKMGMVVRSG